MTKLTDPNGADTEYTYDGAGRLLTATYHDASIEIRTYWNNGLLKTVTDTRGKTTYYHWTSSYQPDCVYYPDGGMTTNIVYPGGLSIQNSSLIIF